MTCLFRLPSCSWCVTCTHTFFFSWFFFLSLIFSPSLMFLSPPSPDLMPEIMDMLSSSLPATFIQRVVTRTRKVLFLSTLSDRSVLFSFASHKGATSSSSFPTVASVDLPACSTLNSVCC